MLPQIITHLNSRAYVLETSEEEVLFIFDKRQPDSVTPGADSIRPWDIGVAAFFYFKMVGAGKETVESGSVSVVGYKVQILSWGEIWHHLFEEFEFRLGVRCLVQTGSKCTV